MSIITGNVYESLLRRDYLTFVQRSFAHLHPSTPLSNNWHVQLIADRLDSVRQGAIRRLIINLPPRGLKSICTSVALPAWILAHDPSRRIICASYGQDLADKHARDCRRIMMSDWYRYLFPTRLAERTATSDFETTQQGGRLSTSVGGPLTGRGGDFLIIDDPIKPDEALSDSQRAAANRWFDQTLYTRQNDKNTDAIVIVMQRLHLDDLVGHVQEHARWEVLSLPAIAPIEETWRYRTWRGAKAHVRKIGEPLQPERESLEALRQTRETLGEYAFSAQYQQEPVPLGGGLIKLAWLHYYSSTDLPAKFDSIVQSWDGANKANELADYSVCTTFGLKDNQIYLLNVLRKRLEYPDLKRAVHEQARLWLPYTILIEDRASGTQLLQELASEGLGQVQGINPVADKFMRMYSQTAVIENGCVHFPRGASWLAEYVRELTSFPQCKFDDQVDSTAQALAWIADAGREPAFLRFLRVEADRKKRREGIWA